MDYYQVLQLNRDASTQDIRQAYKRLALLYHPDKLQGDASIFKQILEAYGTLKDPLLRAAYDQTLPTRDQDLEKYISIFENWISMMYDKIKDTMLRNRQDDTGSENTNAQYRPFVNKMKTNTYDTSQSRSSDLKQSGDIRLRVKVSLDDLYLGSAKKIFYKVKRNGDVCTRYVCIDLTLSQSMYTFSNEGDENDGVRGTLYVHVEVEDHALVSRSPTNCTDLVMYKDISLYDLYYGLKEELSYLGGDTLLLKKQFFTRDALYLPDDHNVFVQEVPEHGLPYPYKDEIRYGSLFVYYRLVLPKISSSLMSSYDFHHGIKTYFQSNGNGS